ncbi:hypothetical protein SNE40_007639 [Patella caerulea]|uniref:Ferric-chelate reductase 1 n=1 Tax=Patella caerulea TaxID=87958 RepID=A0AAN8JYX4_PATCE
MWNCLYLSVFLVGIMRTDAYRDGAPDDACDSMDPSSDHGADPQTSPSPYVVTVSAGDYVPGTPVEVKLESKSGWNITGFLLEARRADPNKNRDELIGNFDEIKNTKQICKGHALTHTNNKLRLPLVIKWNPPSKPAGHIHFRATFVFKMKTFWINVLSDVVMDNSSKPFTIEPSTPALFGLTDLTSTQAATQTTLPVKLPEVNKFEKPDGCGKDIGCFGNCDASGCTFMLTWKDVGDKIEMAFEMVFGNELNKWMAIALSDDVLMGDDSVIECVSVDGNVKAFQSYNDKTGKRNRRLEHPSIGMVLQSTSFEDGVLKCKLTREKSVKGDDKVFDMNDDWYLLATYGDSREDFGISDHVDSLTWSTDGPIDMQKVSDNGMVTTQYPLMKAHGILMVISWMVSAAVGLITARYLKPFWPTSSIGGQKVWIQVHRWSMILTLLISSIGFILVFIDNKGYSQIIGDNYKKAHPIIGIIVTIMVYGNAFMSYFRTGPGTPYRPLFNRAHFAVGTGSYVLAVICIFFGVQLSKLELPESSLHILTAYAVWVSVAYILMELIPYIPRPDSKSVDLEMTAVDAPEKPKVKPNPSPTTNIGIKKFVLFVHIMAVLGLSIALMYLIVVN